VKRSGSRVGRKGSARWHAIDSHGALAIVEDQHSESAGFLVAGSVLERSRDPLARVVQPAR
jgi:hypothetical protein